MPEENELHLPKGFDPKNPEHLAKQGTALAEGDRMTCHLAVHHESQGEEPLTTPPLPFVYRPTTRHQPYVRRVVITPEAKPVDVGWIPEGEVGFVFIQNRTGLGRQRQLSEEERKIEEGKWIVVRRTPDDPGYELPPKASFFAFPRGPGLTVESTQGEIKASIIVYGK